MMLYLIPTILGENANFDTIFPPQNREIIASLQFFIVENVRTARRFIKKIAPEKQIDDLTFFELNEHTSPFEIENFLAPMRDGNAMGVISEAGCPAVADPGADVVALAQAKNYEIMPLIGPSSILLALMASGFNGQSFAFAGYLPIHQPDRNKMLKKLENHAYTENQSQIFIETPYRNMKLLEDILTVCQPATRLCIAADLTLDTQFIKTKTVGQWKKHLPDLHKRPCIFLIYK